MTSDRNAEFSNRMEGSNYCGYGYKTQHSYRRSEVNHLKKARGEIWPKHSEEETTQKTTKMRIKSPQ